MNQKAIKLVVCSLVMLMGIFGYSSTSSASEGAGGQVNLGGTISFYEESTESSGLSATIESNATAKPAGKNLPSTGERMKSYGIFGSGLLLLVGLFLFLRKRRKGERN